MTEMTSLSVPVQWILWAAWTFSTLLSGLIAIILRHIFSEFKALEGRLASLEDIVGLNQSMANSKFEERTTVQSALSKVNDRLDSLSKDMNSRLDSQTLAITAQINQVQNNLVTVLTRNGGSSS